MVLLTCFISNFIQPMLQVYVVGLFQTLSESLRIHMGKPLDSWNSSSSLFQSEFFWFVSTSRNGYFWGIILKLFLITFKINPYRFNLHFLQLSISGAMLLSPIFCPFWLLSREFVLLLSYLIFSLRSLFMTSFSISPSWSF